MKLKSYRYLLIASTLLVLPACEDNSNVNRQDGVKDAIGARPYEELRDNTEDAGDAVREAGRDLKDAVDGD